MRIPNTNFKVVVGRERGKSSNAAQFSSDEEEMDEEEDDMSDMDEDVRIQEIKKSIAMRQCMDDDLLDENASEEWSEKLISLFLFIRTLKSFDMFQFQYLILPFLSSPMHEAMRHPPQFEHQVQANEEEEVKNVSLNANESYLTEEQLFLQSSTDTANRFVALTKTVAAPTIGATSVQKPLSISKEIKKFVLITFYDKISFVKLSFIKLSQN